MADTVRVGPTEQTPTHHIKLSDGTTTLGMILLNGKGEPSNLGIRQSGMPRTAMQISQGSSDYGSYEMPYTPMIQSDWIGGRGAKSFEKDKSKYADSYRADTVFGSYMAGPKVTRLDIEGKYQDGGQAPSDNLVSGGLNYQLAFSFVAAHNMTNPTVAVWAGTTPGLYDLPGDANTLTVYLCANDTNKPGTVLAYYTFNGATGASYMDVVTRTFDTSGVSLVSGTKYWIVYQGAAKQVAMRYANITIKATAGVTNAIMRKMAPDLEWEAFPGDPFYSEVWFQVWDRTSSDARMLYFEYQRQLYGVVSYESGGAPSVYAFGYKGIAKDNSSNLTVTNTSLNVTENSLVGGTIIIWGGSGSTEFQAWRKITANTGGANCVITVDHPWAIPHNTTTYFSIVGVDAYTAVTSHGLTASPTDIMVANGIVYFAQGDYVAIRRMREYDNSGTWTRQWADDSTNKALFLKLIPKTTGGFAIWRANNSDVSVSKSELKPWGTDLAFGTAITVGDVGSWITNLIGYGNPVIPWVLKEDEIGSISTDNVYASVPIQELNRARSDRNGKSAIHWGVYLYFSMLNGIERYYENRLDDMGPDGGEGLPAVRKGYVSDMITYPGLLYASIDAGRSGESSIMVYNSYGWHEIFREVLGFRIRDLYIQVVPGSADRLWFGGSWAANYIPISLDPLNTTGYAYAPYASLESAWISGGLKEIKKFWKALGVFGEKYPNALCYVKASYKLDDDVDWTSVPNTYNTEPFEEADLSAMNNVTSRRFKYRIEIFTDTLTSPRIEAVRLDAVTRTKPKRSWNISFALEDYCADLCGNRSENSAATLEALLRTWSDSELTPAPLLLSHNLSIFNGSSGIYVFIDPASIQPAKVVTTPKGESRMVGSMTVYEA